MRWLIHALALAAFAQTGQSPPPSGQTVVADAVLAGRVVDGLTGRPVGNAVVILLMRPAPGQPPVSSTGQFGGLAAQPSRILVDGEGRFSFTALRPGTYELQATRRGYVPGGIGKLRPDGSPQSLQVAEHARHADVVLRVWKHAAIAGVVIDEANEPVVGVSVYAHRREWVVGELRLVMSGTGATTDDRGAFRIGGLLAGDYLVSVPSTQRTIPGSLMDALNAGGTVSPDVRTAVGLVASAATGAGTSQGQRVDGFVTHTPASAVINPQPGEDGRVRVYPTVHHPASPDGGGAGLLRLAAGETHTLSPIQLRPMPSVRLSGLLRAPEGVPPLTTLTLIPQNVQSFASESGFETARTNSDASGRFTFLGLTPGSYRLVANSLALTIPAGHTVSAHVSVQGQTYWLSETITVGATDMEVALSLKPTLRVAGTLVFDAKAAPPRADQVERGVVALAPANGRQTPEATGRDVAAPESRFLIQEVAGGRYLVRPNLLPAGWSIQSVTRQGQDIIDMPIDVTDDLSDIVVTLTDRPASLRGMVRTVGGQADAEAFVILAPQDSRHWVEVGRTPMRLRGSRVGVTGTFTFGSVPPGDYVLIAIHDSVASRWQSSAFLASIAGQATRVRIAAAAVATQDLVRIDVK